MKNRGITLIALVITIIVLLILAGITLSLTLGENGILQKARTAKIDSEIAREKEQILLAMNSSFGDDGKNAKVIDKNKMEQNLQATEGKDNVKIIADIEEDESFYVKFIKTNRYYEIDLDRNVTLIEVTGGEKQLTVKCIDSNKNVLATKTWIILKDNFSKTLPKVEGYLPEKEKLVDKITEDTTIEILYYYLIPESQMVFTGLTSSGAVATNVSQIASYMIGDNSNTNGNGLVSAPTNLSALKIPDTYNGKPITAIGKNAFKSSGKIVTVFVSDSVKTIGEYAFNNCQKIDNITLGKQLTKINANAFASCSNLLKIIYNNETKAIVSDAFNGCANWTEIEVNANNNTFKVIDNILYSKDGSKLIKVPTGKSGEIIIGNNVTEIGANALHRCTQVTTISIGSGMNKIGSNAFLSCSNLLKIIYNNETTAIVSDAFNGCTNWTEIEVNSNNNTFKVIDNILYSEDGNKLIKVPTGRSGEIIVSNNVTEIGTNAFSRCTQITAITIGSGVTQIQENAFNSCSNLSRIIYNNETMAISKVAFSSTENWTKIEVNSNNNTFKVINDILYSKDGTKILRVPTGIDGEFVLNDSLTEIGTSAFRNCSKITKVIIGNAINKIDINSFNGCTNLSKLVYNSEDMAITNTYFSTCINLTEIEINSNNNVFKVENNVLYSKDGTKLLRVLTGTSGEFSVPAGVTELGKNSFIYCSKITDVNIGNGVTKINATVFNSCTGLKSITIGSSVSNIGPSVFNGCNNLKTVIINSSTVASSLTSQDSGGNLVYYATTVYTNSTPGSYITNNFKTVTSDKPGYTKYVKK